MASNEAIASYYDANTRRFLRYGGSRDVAAIHRAIWAPEVGNRQQAFQYLNDYVATAIRPLTLDNPSGVRVLDLGCGVGGTATYLHKMLGIEVLGISISQSQVLQARSRAQQLGCAEQVRFQAGNFEALEDRGGFNAACAIESFVHCQSLENVLRTAAQQLVCGGLLIVCDDFLNPSSPAEAAKWIARFKRGWKINHLISKDDFVAQAEEQGFSLVNSSDLSAFVRSFPWPVLTALSVLTRLPVPAAYWQNLSGGTALQICLKRVYTQYHALILKKT